MAESALAPHSSFSVLNWPGSSKEGGWMGRTPAIQELVCACSKQSIPLSHTLKNRTLQSLQPRNHWKTKKKKTSHSASTLKPQSQLPHLCKPCGDTSIAAHCRLGALPPAVTNEVRRNSTTSPSETRGSSKNQTIVGANFQLPPSQLLLCHERHPGNKLLSANSCELTTWWRGPVR